MLLLYRCSPFNSNLLFRSAAYFLCGMNFCSAISCLARVCLYFMSSLFSHIERVSKSSSIVTNTKVTTMGKSMTRIEKALRLVCWYSERVETKFASCAVIVFLLRNHLMPWNNLWTLILLHECFNRHPLVCVWLVLDTL